jgi:hypothetical protein
MMKTADDYLSMAVDLAFQNVREHGGRRAIQCWS